ncbi:MAG: enoyl-CoA hydratase/isomerase family protein [Planctomycetota bacterium]|jgi:enoyl-CoA hydratase
MSDTVMLEADAGLATLRMARAHGNAINGELLDDLVAACGRAEEDPDIRGVMLTGAGKLFCPGLDLIELMELDGPAMEDFLARFTRCLQTLYTFPKPMVARIHGHAVAGGCVLSLTADWRVLCEGAMVGLNEVPIGVPLPFAVTMILRESAPSPKIEEVALFGRNYRGEDAVSVGLVHETHAAEGFDEHCRARLEELAAKEDRAFSITKRYLRSPVVERIAAREEALMHEFLDSWFSPSTQERLQGVVEELRARSK